MLATHAQREAALAAVRVGRYAASARAGVKSHRKLVRKALAQWCMVPYPPTVEKVEMVAAVLKEGEYRSASSYLGQYRSDSERAGCEVPGPVQRAFKDMTRSCNHGLGP